MGQFRIFIELLIKEHDVSLDVDAALLRLCGHMDYSDWCVVRQHVMPIVSGDNARAAMNRIINYMSRMDEGNSDLR